MQSNVGIRWTVGDVSPAGFESLQLSLHSVVRLFGSSAEYKVCVNTIPVEEARHRTGVHPDCVGWCSAPTQPPCFLRQFLGTAMAEGVAWKFLPARLFQELHELALDNDVILWEIPDIIRDWLCGSDRTACLIAADDVLAHGKFAELCGPAPRNSGIRGLPPEFDYEAALKAVLEKIPASLESELDEQGLQVAAVSLKSAPLVVSSADVSICSPFYPHNPELGRCGAHFVGINARHLPWTYYGRPAIEVRLAHWMRLRDELYRRTGFVP